MLTAHFKQAPTTEACRNLLAVMLDYVTLRLVQVMATAPTTVNVLLMECAVLGVLSYSLTQHQLSDTWTREQSTPFTYIPISVGAGSDCLTAVTTCCPCISQVLQGSVEPLADLSESNRIDADMYQHCSSAHCCSYRDGKMRHRRSTGLPACLCTARKVWPA